MKNLFIEPEKIYILNPYKIEVGLLTLLLIKSLKEVVLTNKSHANLKKAIDIINRRLEEEDDDDDARDILDCKEVLIKEGLGRFAEL
jgi:hypothetical protein